MSQNGLQKAGILLSLISIITVLLSVKLVTDKMDTVASMQFGGKENYELAKQLFTDPSFAERQKKQLTDAIEQMKSANTAGTATDTTKTDTAKTDTTNTQQPSDPLAAFPQGTINAEQVAAVKKDAVIEGDKDAKILIVEYSDPECPYCVRHFNDKTISTVAAAYPGGVAHTFKAVQGVNHAGTEKKSLAIYCAAKLGGDKAFVNLYTSMLSKSTPSAMIPLASLPDLYKAAGLDTAAVEKCIESGDTKALYAANWAEYRTFTNEPGTPGNLVLNTQTGKWRLIAGAYPADAFKQVIDSLK